MKAPTIRAIAAVAALLAAVPVAAQARTITLDEAVAVALRQSPVIRASVAGRDAARDRVDEAIGGAYAGAGYLPSLSGTATYTRSTANSAVSPGVVPLAVTSSGGTTGGGRPGPSNTSYNQYRFGLALTQPIWDFGRTYGAVQSARAGVDVAAEGVEVSRLTTWYTVFTRYYAVLANQEMVTVAERTVEQNKTYVGRANAQYEAGTGRRVDVVTFVSNEKSAEGALITAQDALAVAKANLLASMGERNWSDFTVATPADGAFDEVPSTTEEVVQRAFEQRPEWRQGRAGIAQQEATVRSLIGNYLPMLAAQGSVTDAGLQLDSTLVWNWSVGVTLTVPLLAAPLTVHQVGEAKATLRGLLATQESTEIQVRTDVQTAAAQLVDARAKLEPVNAALEAAVEAQHLSEGRYEQGSAPFIELLDAQVAAANAEANVVQARLNLATAWAAWQHALGRIPGE
jgi:outer membrane protein TolC